MSNQCAFGNFDHDSIQYHFYCGDIVGAGRLFATRTLEHGSLWVFDGETYRELQNTNAGFDRTSDSMFEVQIETLSFKESNGEVTITSESADGSERAIVRLNPKTDLRWEDTISTVVHQPDIEVELELNGQLHKGVGYCKRYSWTPAPHHWGYRFIQGFLDGGEISIWTAEATFGLNKYDYFKMLMPNGELITTSNDVSCHRLNSVYADSSMGPVEIQIEARSVWEGHLVSDGMDSLLRQRACTMNVKTNHWEKQGLAINETCYGTLG